MINVKKVVTDKPTLGYPSITQKFITGRLFHKVWWEVGFSISLNVILLLNEKIKTLAND